MVSVGSGRRPRVGSNPTTCHFDTLPFVVTPKMRLGGDMGPNIGTTINKIACITNRLKLNSTSHTLKVYLQAL
ncbi:hypothetical protein E2C01_050558 [Portunus trituberculatus]|uniref:Uncharacterized protein n=1 Tax=Portunus trituberculatus TaxID=210409 RepID=A0A5B7GJB5_PORTR|nr:hypothetical protein [Portunus trituberculatus]